MSLKTFEDLHKDNIVLVNGHIHSYVSVKDVYFVVQKNNKVLFIAQIKDILKYLKEQHKEKLESKLHSHIVNWIERSVKKHIKYLGYNFSYYNKKWERKIKIEKILNGDNN